jgi:hypothetical protein
VSDATLAVASSAQPRGSVDNTYSHAIPAMQEEAAALIAGLVFSAA